MSKKKGKGRATDLDEITQVGPWKVGSRCRFTPKRYGIEQTGQISFFSIRKSGNPIAFIAPKKNSTGAWWVIEVEDLRPYDSLPQRPNVKPYEKKKRARRKTRRKSK